MLGSALFELRGLALMERLTTCLVRALFTVIAVATVIGASFEVEAAPPARVQTFIRNVDRELTKNPLFHSLEGLAERHGFEIYLEKESADSLFRLVGTDWLESAKSLEHLGFLGANENVQLVVRGSEYHLELVRTLIAKHLERINPFTKKSRWQTRLESPDERTLQPKFQWMVPKAYVACRDCNERVDERFVDFFLDNEADERTTQKSLELLLKLRELDRAVQTRPTKIKAELFHEVVTMISQMNVFRIAEHELPVIFEVMSSIDASTQTPNHDNTVLIRELQTMGFAAKFKELTKRILALPQYRYVYDFWHPPDLIQKQAGAVSDYLKWTLRPSCEALFGAASP
jgi:hypothetical protein